MDHIKKISAYALLSVNVLLIIAPLSCIILWTFMDSSFIKYLIDVSMLSKPITTPEGIVTLSQIEWRGFSKFVGFMSSIISMIPFIIGLLYLQKILFNYRKGDVFSPINATYYHKIAWLFFWNALLTMPLSEGLMVVAVTLSNAPGHRYFTLSFGTPNLSLIILGCLGIILSWVMVEATKISDDQKLII